MEKRGRPDREDYIFIGFILGWIFLIWCAYSYQKCGKILDQCSLSALEEWQTLVAGLFALFAATATVLKITQQIKSSEAQFREERAATLKGYRALFLTSTE